MIFSYINGKGDERVAHRYDPTMSAVDIRQPWVMALFLIFCVPLFPEYVAPFVSVAAFFFALADVRRHHRRLRVGEAGKVVVIFLSFMALHLLWASDKGLSLLSWVYWAAMFLSYLSLTSILISPRRIETALFILSVIVGLLGLIACAQYICVALLHIECVPLQVWDFLDERVYALVDMNIHLHSLGIRAAATFANPNLFSQFMIMAIPFVAAYGFTGTRSAARILARVSLVLAVGGVFVSFSRGAYLALGAIAVVMCVANIRRLVPILVVAFSGCLLLPASVWERLGSVGNASDVAISERFQVWGITMQAFLERPLTGHGIGLGGIWPRLAESGFAAPHAHNTFLEFLVEGGILGLVLLLFLLWKLFREGFELIIHNPRIRMYGAAVIAFCGGFCVSGMVDYPLFAPKLIGMFFVVLSFTDAMGFVDMKRTPATLANTIPFFDAIHRTVESWVRKKTDPKTP